MNTVKTTQEIGRHFSKLAKNFGCSESVHVSVSHWSGGNPWLTITMYSIAKTENHQSKYSISADMAYDNCISYKCLELKLQADIIQKTGNE